MVYSAADMENSDDFYNEIAPINHIFGLVWLARLDMQLDYIYHKPSFRHSLQLLAEG